MEQALAIILFIWTINHSFYLLQGKHPHKNHHQGYNDDQSWFEDKQDYIRFRKPES